MNIAVEHSITGRRWEVTQSDDREALAIAQRYHLPDTVARILAARQIGLDHIDDFLNPTLRQLPDPYGLIDMEKAATILAGAIIAKKTIGILGDYDVDGATSTSLLRRYIHETGGKTTFHIPCRFTEGYGPSALGFDKLIQNGAELIVTLDCGITSTDLIGEYADRVPILIIDHHLPGADLPRAAAIVNPNRLDCAFDHKYLAACGVTFFLIMAINRILRDRGHFGAALAEPDLKTYLDLVALGTVADIVPLLGVNRIFVRRGLEILGMRGNVGLRALADVARLDGKPDAYHLGFLLGPRINAAGRLQDASLGVQLLAESEDWRAQDIARQLDKLNTERQELEQTILAQAIDQVDASSNDAPVILAANENWHPGVIGIVASRLKDRYHKPSFVVAMKAGQGTGSARSVHGFDLGSAVLAAQQLGILDKGGGHAMAAGFKITADKMDQFRQFITGRFIKDTANANMTPRLAIDALAQPGALNMDLLQNLKKLEPFGQGNPQPRFAVKNVQIAFADIMKEKHLRLTLRGMDGAEIKAVAFRVMEGKLGKFLSQSKGAQIHVAGTLRENNFNGRTTAQFQIDDAAELG